MIALSVLSFVSFVIAAILKLVHVHQDMVTWLIIIGGLLISAAVAWGWAGPRWGNRPPA